MAFQFFQGPHGVGGAFRNMGRRRFKRGMLKWILLAVLAEGERHGYDFIRLFRDRGWGGAGAGSVYPLLAMLEDEGLVTAREEDGKRVYVISEKGREALRQGPRFDVGDLFEEAAEESPMQDALKRLVAACTQAQGHVKPETAGQVVDILNRARKDIYTLLANE